MSKGTILSKFGDSLGVGGGPARSNIMWALVSQWTHDCFIDYLLGVVWAWLRSLVYWERLELLSYWLLLFLDSSDLSLCLLLPLVDFLNQIVSLLKNRQKFFVFPIFLWSLFLGFMLILKIIDSLGPINRSSSRIVFLFEQIRDNHFLHFLGLKSFPDALNIKSFIKAL